MTATIRLDDALKTRVAAAAQAAGKTAHAFMRDAIADSVEQAELDAAFRAVAEARWAGVVATGQTVPWDEARIWLEARSRGQTPQRPVARSNRD